MQGSHLEATLRASAINSLVFLSSTPLAVAARPRSLKLFMTSGVLDLNVERSAETDCVSSRKLLVWSDMAFLLLRPGGRRSHQAGVAERLAAISAVPAIRMTRSTAPDVLNPCLHDHPTVRIQRDRDQICALARPIQRGLGRRSWPDRTPPGPVSYTH